MSEYDLPPGVNLPEPSIDDLLHEVADLKTLLKLQAAETALMVKERNAWRAIAAKLAEALEDAANALNDSGWNKTALQAKLAARAALEAFKKATGGA